MRWSIVLNLLVLSAVAAWPNALAQQERVSRAPAGNSSQPLIAGQPLFESHCAACHGLDGRGGEHAHAIATPQAAGALPDSALAQTIRGGIPSQGMPSFSLLSDAEIRNVIAYLRFLTKQGAAQEETENAERSGQSSAGKAGGSPSPLTVHLEFAPERLRVSPPAADWPSYNGDYTGRRFSALDQINPENVHRLRTQWVFHPANSEALEVTPVVVDGVMYVTSANNAYALDARTGHVLWSHTRPPTSGLIDDASAHHNRGAALWHARLFMETDDAHLLCLDARSGRLLWDVTYADTRKNYGATSAPLIVNDKVLVGTSGGDDGVRGFIAAFDPVSGKEVWQFWTIPAPGEPGSESWPGDSYLHGGGTTWMPGTYDPETNTLFWATSNPAPDFDGRTRPGDDLYTDCVLALNPDTGKLNWYFQFTPHDLYDYDATQTPVLVDLTVDGRVQKLLVEANRNGFFYTLDRTTGKFLRATPFVEKLTWAKAVDGQGRPIRTGLIPTPEGTKVCPSIAGATNWMSPSYNPSTHQFYFMALEDCEIFTVGKTKQEYKPGEAFYNTGSKRAPNESAQKILIAMDVATGREAWRNPQAGPADSWGGTMTTASGLVFFGNDSQEFEAADARTGKSLWHFNTGQVFHASPMSYSAGGVQHIAIAAGSDVFSFALPSE